MAFFRWLLWFLVALVMHAAVIAFGGLLMPKAKEVTGTTQQVDLLSDVADDAKKKDEKKPDEAKEKKEDELEASKEQPPDAAEILKSLEAPSVEAAPALEAASLGAIEAALNGGGGAGGDFGGSFDPTQTGGVIGGTGSGTRAKQEKVEDAFGMADVDQKPRPIVQPSPVFPAEMRAKKVEGVVTVKFIVDEDGKVQSPIVEKSSNEAFETPALNALRKWKFEPGLRAGKRVSTKMRVTIRFPRN
jgi:protein TonB